MVLYIPEGLMYFDNKIEHPARCFDQKNHGLSYFWMTLSIGVNFKGRAKGETSVLLFAIPLKITESLILAQDERWRRA